MKNILFIHQSAELYGSDKTLLLLLKKIDKTIFCPIVILPNEGPLKVELEKLNIKVVIAPVLKLYRAMFTPKNIFKLINDYNKGISILDTLNAKYKFDIVYSNTLAVLLGLFFSRKRKIKHVWHVHEIIDSPNIIKKIFTYLVSSKLNSKIIFNSNATANFWSNSKKSKFDKSIVWNGLEIFENQLTLEAVNELKASLFKSNPNDVIIGLVGRISSWKGQMILLEAFKNLSKKNENIKLIYIGSPPPNQEKHLFDLIDKIATYHLEKKVLIIPFQKEIQKFWQSIDIAVVPSIEPEPFGLVAVEAMLAGKPVIAANHGGLQEIVLDHETGLFFEPNNEVSLAKALEKLINSEDLRKEYGKNGLERAINHFSVESYSNKIQNILKKL